MELRENQPPAVKAREPADRTTKIAIALVISGGILYALPSLFAYTMKTVFEKALTHGDARSGADRRRQAAPPAPIASKPSPDPQRQATTLTNIAGERRVLGTRMTRLMIVGLDFSTEAGKPPALNLNLKLGPTEAFAVIARQPVGYLMPEAGAEHRIHAAFDGALPVSLGARSGALVAVRDASLPPVVPVLLDTQDKPARERLCASLRRWIEYYAVPLEEVTYWYMTDPKELTVTNIQATGQSKAFKIYSFRTLSEHCPSLRMFEASEAKRSRF